LAHSNKHLKTIAQFLKLEAVRQLPKRRFVLYMLKNVVGEERGFLARSILLFGNKARIHRSVDTEDFLDCISGKIWDCRWIRFLGDNAAFERWRANLTKSQFFEELKMSIVFESKTNPRKTKWN